VSLHQVFNAILYVLREGFRWRRACGKRRSGENEWIGLEKIAEGGFPKFPGFGLAIGGSITSLATRFSFSRRRLVPRCL
jgi:hypothetical protein